MPNNSDTPESPKRYRSANEELFDSIRDVMFKGIVPPRSVVVPSNLIVHNRTKRVKRFNRYFAAGGNISSRVIKGTYRTVIAKKEILQTALASLEASTLPLTRF